MAYTDKAEFNVPRHIVQKGGVNIQSITDNVTLDYNSGTYHIFTLTAVGAKTCMLPSVKDGACIYIRNTAASNKIINVNEPSGGCTVLALAATGEGAIFVSDGAEWSYICKGT